MPWGESFPKQLNLNQQFFLHFKRLTQRVRNAYRLFGCSTRNVKINLFRLKFLLLRRKKYSKPTILVCLILSKINKTQKYRFPGVRKYVESCYNRWVIIKIPFKKEKKNTLATLKYSPQLGVHLTKRNFYFFLFSLKGNKGLRVSLMWGPFKPAKLKWQTIHAAGN